MDMYKGLGDYLKNITETYKLDICINDFVGFLLVDKQLSDTLQPYLIHKEPYCMQIKSNRKLWDRCLRMKRNILLKSARLKTPFYGMCYCGVEEYIVPIQCKDVVIGFICVGEFCSNRVLSEYRIKKTSKSGQMDNNILLNKFELSIHQNNYDMPLITGLIGIIAEYIANLYASLAPVHDTVLIENSQYVTGETYLFSHAAEFIRQNFTQSITVKEVSVFCHCSESYISHIFKKNMKINIKAFINKLRMEKAKSLLLGQNISITEIALMVGFNDSNYFSSAFKKTCGLTPTEFKKRYA